MDYCPSLQSAFSYLETLNFWVDESVKNYNLRDLVIESTRCHSWSSLRRLLSKFPKLNHLAIRSRHGINDDHVKELITLLPDIKLLDLRGSPKVTKRSARYLREYCSKSGRSIVIYYFRYKDPPDWPKLGQYGERICSGFDFMKNCFFKNFGRLPYFLDQ